MTQLQASFCFLLQKSLSYNIQGVLSITSVVYFLPSFSMLGLWLGSDWEKKRSGEYEELEPEENCLEDKVRSMVYVHVLLSGGIFVGWGISLTWGTKKV